jgi:tetratricopeptide (TPR) repeat protein
MHVDELPNTLYKADIWYYSGTAYSNTKDYRSAIKCYQYVVDNHPGYQRAYHAQYMVAHCWKQLSDLEKIPFSRVSDHIRQACTSLLENYPDCRLVKAAENFLAECNRKSNNIKEAF